MIPEIIASAIDPAPRNKIFLFVNMQPLPMFVLVFYFFIVPILTMKKILFKENYELYVYIGSISEHEGRDGCSGYQN